MKGRLFIALYLLGICTSLHGQDWSAMLTIDPNPSPYVSDWQADPTLVSLEVFNYTNEADVIIVRAEVVRNGHLIFRGNSGRLLVEANDMIRIDPATVPHWITEFKNTEVQDKIEQTGMLPEADYEVCVEVVNLWEKILIQNLCSYFTITHPEPPELIYPIDYEEAFTFYPVFQWIPSQMSATQVFTYVFTLVELLDGQLPEIAIEANYTHYRNYNVFDSELEYPLDGLLLEPGKTYVWQVQAIDLEGRPATKNNGCSEIGVFTISTDITYDVPSLELIAPDQGALIITQLPQFEWLPPMAHIEGMIYYTLRIVPLLEGQTDLQAMQGNTPLFENAITLTETRFSYPEWADPFTPGKQYAWQLTAHDHYGYPVAQNDGKSEVRTFTYVYTDLPEDLTELLPERLPLPAEEIAYLQVKANGKCLVECSLSDDANEFIIKSPSPNSVPLCLNTLAPDAVVNATVDLTLNRHTLEPIAGTVNAENWAGLGSPFDLNRAGLPLIVRNIQYDPSGEGVFNLQAAITAFDFVTAETPVRLTLTGGGYLDGELSTSPVTIGIPLIPNHLSMILTEADGWITPAQGIDNLEYTFNLTGSLQFINASQGGEIPIRWSAAGNGWQASAAVGQVVLPVGSYQLTLDILDVESFEYQSGNSVPWLYDFLLNVTPRLTSPVEFALPTLFDLHLMPKGLHFIEMDMNILQEQDIILNNLKITPDMVHIQEGWVNIFDGVSQPDIRFDLSLHLTGLPERLHELREASVSAFNVEYKNGSFIGPLEPRSYLSPLWAPLNNEESLGLHIQALDGNLTGNPEDPLQLSVTADFDPSQTVPGITMLGPVDSLSMDLSGLFAGHLKPAYDNIDFPWGDWSVHLNQSTFFLAGGNSGQAAGLRFDGFISLPAYSPDASVQASGQGRYDLIKAVLDSGKFIFTDPFTLPVPANNPVFSLRCTEGASVCASGIIFNNSDGEMLLEDGSRISVIYSQNVLISAIDHIPQQGIITFSESFALRIRDLNKAADQMSWKAVSIAASADSTAEEMIFNVTGSVRIVQGAWQFPQTASAHISYANMQFSNLNITCSTDLNLSFHPFQINTGQIQLFDGQELIATLDNRGFWPGDRFPVPGWQNLVRLPLPDETIAYLRLKDDSGSWLLDVQDMGLYIKLNTAQDRPVPLVLPGLRYGRSSDPEISAILDNVLVSKSNLIITEGTVRAADEDLPVSLLNASLPIELTAIHFAADDQTIMAAVRPLLPKVFESAFPTIPNILITQNGLDSFQLKDPTDNPLASITIGPQLNCTVASIDGSVMASEKRLILEGQLFVQLFQESGLIKPFDYTMNLQAGQAEFMIQPNYDETNEYTLPLGKARLDVTDKSGNPKVSMQAPFDDENLILTLHTLKLSLPEIGNGLVLMLNDLIIDKKGIQPPEIPTDPAQVFQYGGLNFTLEGEQRVAWETTPPGLMLTLGGTFQLWNRSISFSNLDIGTDGSVSEQNLLPDSVQALEGLLVLTGLTMSNGLKFEGELKPPAPFDALETTSFTINLDGNGIMVDETGNPITDHSITLLESESETAADVYLGQIPMRIRCRLSELKLGLPAPFSQATGNLNIGINTYWPKFELSDPMNSEEKILLTGLIDFDNGRITGETWTLEEAAAPAIVLEDLIILEVNHISVNTDDVFSIQLGGNLTLNCLPGGSGGCPFEEFVLTPNSTKFGRITNGELNLYGFKITVSDFNYGTDPLSFDFSAANISSGSVSQGSRSTKGFYVTFKASISTEVQGFEGGMDQFIIYKDATQFYLLFDNVNFELKDTVKGRLDLEARIPLTHENFQLRITAGGSLSIEDELSFTAVGEIAYEDRMVGGANVSLPGFGLFLAMSMKEGIKIGPVSVTDFGGGIFFNPSDRIEKWVYSHCELDNESEWLQTSFAQYTQTNPLIQVFVFGGVALVREETISGRALFSLSSDHIRLDASLTILKAMSDHLDITAKGHLETGLQDLNTMGSIGSFYLQGNLDIELKLKKLSDTGQKATVAFAVVYSDELYWGLQGNINIDILNILKANYDLIIGNPGFLIQGNISGGFDIGVLSVHAGLDNAVWVVWDQEHPSLGGYLLARIEAEVLAGLAAAKGELGAALIIIPDPYFYGYAKLRLSACWGLASWSGSVWARWRNGSFDGGLGGDPGIQIALAEAAEAARIIKGQTEQVAGALSAGDIPLKLALDEAMMDRIIKNISTGRTELYDLIDAEKYPLGRVLYNFPKYGGPDDGKEPSYADLTAMIDYHAFTDKILLALSPSTIAQIPALKQDADQYQKDLNTELQDHRNSLNQQCQKAKVTLEQLRTAIHLEELKSDTLSALKNPLLTGSSVSDEGVTVPAFDVDKSIHNENTILLNDYSSHVQTALADLQMQIEYLDSIRSVIYAVIGPDGDISRAMEKFVSPSMQSQIDASAINNMEAKYVIYRDVVDHVNQHIYGQSHMGTNLTHLHVYIDPNTTPLPIKTNENARQLFEDFQKDFHALVDRRIGVMEKLSNTMLDVDSWTLDLYGLCSAYETTSRQLYGKVPEAFALHTISQLDTLYLRATRIHRNYNADKDVMHRELTEKLDVIWDQYAELTEKLYTAYQQFILLARQNPDCSADLKNALTGMENRMKVLETELYLPSLCSFYVKESASGKRYSPVNLTLNMGDASNAGGIIEHAYTISGHNFQSIGKVSSFTAPIFPAKMGEESIGVKARYRNIAGLTVESPEKSITIQHGGNQPTTQFYQPVTPTAIPPEFPGQPLVIKNTSQKVTGVMSGTGMEQDCYLMSSGNQIVVSWPQALSSGEIAQYEISVWPWKGSSAIVDWKPAIHKDSASVVVNMEKGKPYEVRVRARDLTGLYSTPLVSEYPLVYNPSCIGFPENAQATVSISQSSVEELYAKLSLPLAGEIYFTTDDGVSCRKFYMENYEFQLLRNGSSIDAGAWKPVSGINSYEGTIQFNFQGNIPDLPLNLPFRETFQIALRVKNDENEIIVPAAVFEVQQIDDPTKPSSFSAEFRGWNADNELLIQIHEPCKDTESDIAGIQVAMGRSTDDLHLKPFQTDSKGHPLFDFGPEKNTVNAELSCPVNIDGSTLAQQNFVIVIRTVNGQNQFTETVLTHSALTLKPYILQPGYDSRDLPVLRIGGILNAQTLEVLITGGETSEILQEQIFSNPPGSVSLQLSDQFKTGPEYTTRIYKKDVNGFGYPHVDQSFTLPPHLPPITVEMSGDDQSMIILLSGEMDARSKMERVCTIYYMVGTGVNKEDIIPEKDFKIETEFRKSIFLPENIARGDVIYLSLRVSTEAGISSLLKSFRLAASFNDLLKNTDFYLSQENGLLCLHFNGSLHGESSAENLAGLKLWIGSIAGTSDIVEVTRIPLSSSQSTFSWTHSLTQTNIGPGSVLSLSVCGFDRKSNPTDTMLVQTTVPNISLPHLTLNIMHENEHDILVCTAEPVSFSNAEQVKFRIGSSRGSDNIQKDVSLTASAPEYRRDLDPSNRGQIWILTARSVAASGTYSLTCYHELKIGTLEAPSLTGTLRQAEDCCLLQLKQSEGILYPLELWVGTSPQVHDILDPAMYPAQSQWDIILPGVTLGRIPLYVMARYVNQTDISPVALLVLSQSE
ncbi:hypothetical protein JW835_08835 [bacterium]|nr:hypothetical protein [bacterium]